MEDSRKSKTLTLKVIGILTAGFIVAVLVCALFLALLANMDGDLANTIASLAALFTALAFGFWAGCVYASTQTAAV